MSQATRSLTTVPFQGANLIVREGRTPADTMIAMKPLVEGMGLNWETQRQRMTRHPVLKEGTCVIQVPSAGGPQDMLFLPLMRLNFFLATIHPERVADDAVRERVIAYQTQCADVLFKEFFGKRLAAVEKTGSARGRNLRTRRQRLGLTIGALAGLSGVTQKTIQLIEEGGSTGQEKTWSALDDALEKVRLAKKAERDRRNATVRLQFTVPADQAATVCAFVSKLLNKPAGEA